MQRPSAEKIKIHLTSNNGVHPNSVEVIRSDFHVRTENAELNTNEYLHFDKHLSSKRMV